MRVLVILVYQIADNVSDVPSVVKLHVHQTKAWICVERRRQSCEPGASLLRWNGCSQTMPLLPFSCQCCHRNLNAVMVQGLLFSGCCAEAGYQSVVWSWSHAPQYRLMRWDGMGREHRVLWELSWCGEAEGRRAPGCSSAWWIMVWARCVPLGEIPLWYSAEGALFCLKGQQNLKHHVNGSERLCIHWELSWCFKLLVNF